MSGDPEGERAASDANRARFELLATDGRARRGRVHTVHGTFETPAFMPVGTRAAVKGLTPEQIAATGTEIVLANTYHLMLRPGSDVVAELGGLHRMMGWRGPILTDSGGFQVFSLADRRTVDDGGVTFRSHLDGAVVRLTPERSIEVQAQLGADIIMAFDECPALPAAPEALRAAVERTLSWARRCREAPRGEHQALYGIVQGGLDVALRRACLERLVALEFDGYALGGLSVGETPHEMWAVLNDFAQELPSERPRYLMGVGTPADLAAAVGAGIDQFDCVLPTRNGRKGYAFTSRGPVRLRNARHQRDVRPLDEACDCVTCRGFSRGYLRHLILSEEVLGATLVSIHNVRFYQALMCEMRQAIEQQRFGSWLRAFAAGPLAGSSEEDAL